MQKYLGNGEKWGVNIVYLHQTSPLGLAHAVKISKKQLGNEDFVMVLGDNFFAVDLKDMIDHHKKNSNRVTVALKEVEDPQ
ncbi:dTDP-glucose pyrophosphorylase [Alkaliphilus hydrothermalis]|uniref:Glucose-1-phosphate thymidylyltransferase n=1 Tax=Alkaliphilus hydrothermalis TaxID=1482730 RepID=A0ABS2NLX8_9FIRM|nr:dTDP-glucose pyrophosphorylase [Alkaliphilus hydrothermalis]